MDRLEIYTDGGCSVHSGKTGCWAYVAVLNDQVLSEDYGVEDDVTNSKMEAKAMMYALLFASEYCRENDGEVVIKSDSQYCVNAYNTWTKGWEKNNWRKSNNKPIEHVDTWKAMHYNLRHERVTVEWVRGHNGNKWNEYVDVLTRNR